MLKKIRKFDQQTLIACLRAKGKKQIELFRLARQIKEEIFGKRIWFRGIIEFSNICRNDCYYCGIRRGNIKQTRFQMSLKEIDDCLKFIKSANYGSVVFQSGELITKPFKEYLLKIVKATHQKYPALGITVSCGEQDYEYLKKLKAAGASRYLLRIETASEKLYKKLHPSQMPWQKRFQCLKDLQKLNYQVGTGIMVGLPGQTDDDLIRDLKFFVDNKFDMYGLGPYVIHKDTPLASDPKVQKWWRKNKEKNFNKLLNFLAILRILLPKVNIAAATACDVFHPLGRIKVLEIAGNVIMPSVTPKNYREKYLLYQDKPCIDEDARKCLGCISLKIKKAGLEPIFGQQGNSPFFLSKK
ncbi:MAG: [FeFe] hydrogenase H-cluster radical SAM maturase HydE [bacterium]|nr:[FeFe] hydrogenase H-cluster radical SAM maturase HydE [bacterium]